MVKSDKNRNKSSTGEIDEKIEKCLRLKNRATMEGSRGTIVERGTKDLSLEISCHDEVWNVPRYESLSAAT
jgi:hypothetical protein